MYHKMRAFKKYFVGYSIFQILDIWRGGGGFGCFDNFLNLNFTEFHFDSDKT